MRTSVANRGWPIRENLSCSTLNSSKIMGVRVNKQIASAFSPAAYDAAMTNDGLLLRMSRTPSAMSQGLTNCAQRLRGPNVAYGQGVSALPSVRVMVVYEGATTTTPVEARLFAIP